MNTLPVIVDVRTQEELQNELDLCLEEFKMATDRYEFLHANELQIHIKNLKKKLT
jgi:hypothetical protein